MREMVRARRGRPPGARARVAGTAPRADGGAALAHVRGAARLRRAGRACCPSWTACGACPSAPSTTPRWTPACTPMMVLDMAAQLAGAAGRALCLPVPRPGQRHHAADMLPRHIGHEQRSARLLQAVAERLRVPNDCTRTGRRGGARARQHPPQRRLERRRRCCACWSAATPSASPRALPRCCWPASAMPAGRLGFEQAAYPQRLRLQPALQAALAVETAPIAQAAAQRA